MYQSKKTRKYSVIAVKVSRVTLKRGLCRIQAMDITSIPMDLPIKILNITELNIYWILSNCVRRLTKRI